MRWRAGSIFWWHRAGASRRRDVESRPELERTDLYCAILAFLAALAVRSLPFADDVFQTRGLVPWRCPDVYYHLHRIDVAARHWPRFPELDFWRNYPDGAYSLWSPLFEFVPATIAVVTGAPPLVIGVVWPALLGALAVFPLLDILRRLHGRAAWLGVALYVVFPGAVSFAALGRADHHVGEVLMQLWVYGLTLRALLDFEQRAHVRTASAIWLGVVMGLSLWMWRGSVVFLAVPAGVALVTVASTRDAALRRAIVRFFALALGLAVLVTLPYGVLNAARGRSPFGAYHLSLLQPAMLFSWALLLAVADQLGATGLRLRPLLHARVLTPLLGVVALAALAADGWLGGVAFLARVGDPWAATIVESQPLWTGGLPTYYVIEQLGFVPWLLLAIAIAQLSVLVRRGPSPAALFVLLCTLCATALVFMQVRFVYYAAPVVVAVPGALWHALRERGRLVQVSAVALTLALMWPATRFWAPALDGNPRTEMRPPKLEPALERLLGELALATPSAGDVHRPELRPSYCVLAPWGLGNFIQTIAHRPVLASSGGPHETTAYADTVRFARQIESEAEAAALMNARGCRYAISTFAASAPGARPDAVFSQRLHGHDGSDWDAHEGSGRFRFRFESLRSRRQRLAEYKVFELVPGVVLRLPAGRATHVETDVGTAQRRFVYRRRLQPGDPGVVTARVSQPGEYRIVDARGAVMGTITVSDQAVLHGRSIALAAAPRP